MDSRYLLDRPIAFHRIFVTLTGSITAALMLSQGVYWSLRTNDEEGWFWKTQEEWVEETGLTRKEQENARKKLRDLKFWQEELRGVPAKLHYRIDSDLLNIALQSAPNKLAQQRESAVEKAKRAAQKREERKQVRTKETNQFARKVQTGTHETGEHSLYTESTTQTTDHTPHAHAREISISQSVEPKPKPKAKTVRAVRQGDETITFSTPIPLEQEPSPPVASAPPKETFRDASIFPKGVFLTWNASVKNTDYILSGGSEKTKTGTSVDYATERNGDIRELPEPLRSFVLSMVMKLQKDTSVNPTTEPFMRMSSELLLEESILDLSFLNLVGTRFSEFQFSMQLLVNHQIIWDGVVSCAESTTSRFLFLRLTVSFPEARAVDTWMEICESFALTATDAKQTICRTGTNKDAQKVSHSFPPSLGPAFDPVASITLDTFTAKAQPEQSEAQKVFGEYFPGKALSRRQWQLIAEQVTDIPKWIRVCQRWSEVYTDWRNFGLLDWYRDGIPGVDNDRPTSGNFKGARKSEGESVSRPVAEFSYWEWQEDIKNGKYANEPY